MNKGVVIVVALLAFCFANVDSQVRIGVHGGINFSDVTEPPNYNHAGTWEMQTHGFGGIVADCQIAEHWLLATQLNFIQKGISIPNSAWGLPLRGTTSLTANYYEIPVKMRYRSGGRPFRWYLEGGLALALLESGRAHTIILPIGTMPGRDETDYVGGMYRQFETSLIGGAGAEFQLTSTFTLMLSASYAFGMSDVYDDFWADAKSRGGQCDLGVLVTL